MSKWERLRLDAVDEYADCIAVEVRNRVLNAESSPVTLDEFDAMVANGPPLNHVERWLLGRCMSLNDRSMLAARLAALAMPGSRVPVGDREFLLWLAASCGSEFDLSTGLVGVSHG